MADIKMNKAIGLSENSADMSQLSDEVIDYVHRVANTAEMDEQFWNDFMLGAALWGLTAGYLN